jgi:hypothetical protein
MTSAQDLMLAVNEGRDFFSLRLRAALTAAGFVLASEWTTRRQPSAIGKAASLLRRNCRGATGCTPHFSRAVAEFVRIPIDCPSQRNSHEFRYTTSCRENDPCRERCGLLPDTPLATRYAVNAAPGRQAARDHPSAVRPLAVHRVGDHRSAALPLAVHPAAVHPAVALPSAVHPSAAHLVVVHPWEVPR